MPFEQPPFFIYPPVLLSIAVVFRTRPWFVLYTDGLYTYKGSDAPKVYEDGRPGENYFYDNDILNTATGVKLKRADNIEVMGEFSLIIRPSRTLRKLIFSKLSYLCVILSSSLF